MKLQMMSLFYPKNGKRFGISVLFSFWLISCLALEIYSKDLNQTIIKPAGFNLLLNCNINVSNVTWYKDDEIISHDRKINRTSCTINDSGNYVCKGYSGRSCEPTNYIYKVQIIERFLAREPSTENYSKRIVVQESDDAVFDCPSSSSKALAQLVKINYNAKEKKNAPEQTIYQTKAEKSTGNRFLLPNVTWQDEGWYVCKVTNEAGTSYFDTYLKINKRQSDELKHTSIYVIIIAILGILFLAAMVTVWYIKNTLKKERKDKQTAIESAMVQLIKKIIIKEQPSSDDQLKNPVIEIERYKVTETSGRSKFSNGDYELPLDERWEFPRSNLELAEGLGEGMFGKVVKGKANGIMKKDVVTVVAVKMLKEIKEDYDMIHLISEMEIMKKIGKHENVLSLLGCCSQDGTLLVILEYAPHGNLRDFLRQHHSSLEYESKSSRDKLILSKKTLVSFAYQIAKAMEYLSSKKCIHRDLAARNVLVGDNFTMKISDFGLSKYVEHTDYYKKTSDGRLPVRWMAPESLFRQVFTTQSDVWSYGILLWEIMTFGGVPYPSFENVRKLMELLLSGYRMSKPSNCPLQIYYVMRDCWSYAANERPVFSTIVKTLKEFLEGGELLQMRCSDSEPLSAIEELVDSEDEEDGLL